MFTHIDANGNASMVDVSKKNDTLREAHAEGTITLNKEIQQFIPALGTCSGVTGNLRRSMVI